MRLAIFVALLISTCNVFGQKQKPLYYLYDKEWKATKDVDSAKYIVQTTTVGDSLFVNRIFKGMRYLWVQESFSDAAQTIPHGQFAWYDEEGRIDSSGFVIKGKKNGTWSYYDDTLGVFLSVHYQNGREMSRRDYINKVVKFPNGQKTFDEEKRERDSLKLVEQTFKADEKEAIFKGGMAGYKKYLERNLVPPANLFKTGHVKVQFLINQTGKIQNLLILRSLQLSADMEALRVLSEMPDWTPAYQNGKNVFYQAIQYITFKLG